MSPLEIILTIIAVLTTGAAVLLTFVLMHRTWKRQEQTIKARTQNAHREHEEPAKPPTTDEGLDEKAAQDALEKAYPPGFKTTYLGQTVWTYRSWVVSRGNRLNVFVTIGWWDGFKHLQRADLEASSMKALAKTLEPKKHYVGVDPAPVDDDEGAPV